LQRLKSGEKLEQQQEQTTKPNQTLDDYINTGSSWVTAIQDARKEIELRVDSMGSRLQKAVAMGINST